MQGRFITLEGLEGVGKSTQLEFVERVIRDAGFSVRVTREPGGTDLGERIREWVLGGRHAALAGETEALLMFAARAQHLAEVIRPALSGGIWVVCDRFSDASFAYQVAGRGVAPDLFDCLERTVQRGLEPDLTLWLDAPVQVGLSRISSRSLDHFERESETFFERVRDGYQTRARAAPRRIRRIDASGSIGEVQRQIAESLAELLASAGAPP
jgi:dTMP kinase